MAHIQAWQCLTVSNFCVGESESNEEYETLAEVLTWIMTAEQHASAA